MYSRMDGVSHPTSISSMERGLQVTKNFDDAGEIPEVSSARLHARDGH